MNSTCTLTEEDSLCGLWLPDSRLPSKVKLCEEQAGDEAGTLGIKDEAARMKVTPPLAVAPLAHGDDMRWNPNDNGINFNP